MIIGLTDICDSTLKLAGDVHIHIFIWMVILDILSGTIKAFTQKVGNSTKGLKGLLKHLLVVFTVLLANVYLPFLGYNAIAKSFLLFFMIQYAISIIENWGQMGLPLPSRLKDLIYKLNDKYDQEMEDELKNNKKDKLI